MGCYTVPLAAAILLYFGRKNHDSQALRLLNFILGGSSVMLVIDHAWNDELLAFSASDLLLGFVMTAGAMLFWAAIITVEKTRLPAPTEKKA